MWGKTDILQEIQIPRSNPATWGGAKEQGVPSIIETRCLTAQFIIIVPISTIIIIIDLFYFFIEKLLLTNDSVQMLHSYIRRI